MLPGVGGTLFPRRYLTDRLLVDAGPVTNSASLARGHRQLLRWWRGVAERCGPASGLHALFDLIAMPLFGILGYRAQDVRFETGRVYATLTTRGGNVVGLVIVPWASRPPGIWRDLFQLSRASGAPWCFVVAPPFLSLVDVRGRATRRSADFMLPGALDTETFPRFWTLTCAESFEPAGSIEDATNEAPEPARIDALVRLAACYQDRVREDLQHGVVDAIGVLSGAAGAGRDEALVIVYRILFLLFAEARELVPTRHPTYGRAYSVSGLVADALAVRETRGTWDGLGAITRLSRLGCRTDDLIVRPFNGRLFARRAAPSLEARHRGRGDRRAAAQDEAMRRALVALGSRQGPAGREEITYADLGVEQLGAVYERVLDLEPASAKKTSEVFSVIQPRKRPPRSFSRQHSVPRKQTGTFYTPQPLAEFVVRRTLAPLVAGVPADQILRLRVVDPAMGSGAFLVAACRYLSAAYERALLDEGRLTPSDIDEESRAAMRRVVAEHCLAGVDANPVAVQLARLSLWLTTLAHGRPLTFLDHRLRVGNSLVGATPDDLTRVPGRRHAEGASLPLFEAAGLEESMREAIRPLGELDRRPDDTVADVRAKEALWERFRSTSSPLNPWRLAADAWCALWFPAEGTRPPSSAELRALIDAVVREDRTFPAGHLARRLAEAHDARRREGFFHWPLEFSDVFYGDTGRRKDASGFDAVLGNPPWEMLRRDAAGNPARNCLTRFVRDSGVYRTCTRGHLNLYQPFVERALSICRTGGRVGLIVPWGLAVDDGAAGLRRALVDRGGLETLVGLDNALGLFPIHRGVRFAVVVIKPGHSTNEIRARFGVRTNSELDALPDHDNPRDTSYPIRLTLPRLRRIGGPTLRVPDVRHVKDLEVLERLSTDFPPLGQAGSWGARFSRELNASDDRASFGSVGLPLVEGKHIEPFRVHVAQTTFRVSPDKAARLLPDRRYTRPRLGYRDVSSVGNMRSLIAAVLPADVVTTHTIFCLRTPVSVDASHFLCGVFNSFVMNLIVRMLMGSHVTSSLAEQLPVPVWTRTVTQRRISRLARRLARGTAHERLAARLDAEVVAMYGVSLVDYQRIVDGFPLVPRRFREMVMEELKKLSR